jgi:hypothetical protein
MPQRGVRLDDRIDAGDLLVLGVKTLMFTP